MAHETEVALDRILRAPETSALAQQSRARLTNSELSQLEALMTQTKASYPAQEIPPETVEMWAPAWMALAIQYGLPAIRAALQAHMLASRFFPHPSEVRESLEALKPARDNVYVPSTRREVARLCGAKFAAGISEMTVEDVAEQYGPESARLYRAKLEAERRGR